MDTIEIIKHGVENRTKELTILVIVAIGISALWLINLLLYPDKPELHNPALPIISIIICCVIWIYLFKTEWFKNFKKHITIGQHELNFMENIKLIIRVVRLVIAIIMAQLYILLIKGPLLTDLFPAHHILIRILLIFGAFIFVGAFILWLYRNLKKDHLI